MRAAYLHVQHMSIKGLPVGHRFDFPQLNADLFAFLPV
jgi:hypothetical protein